jgi:colicin import membrane protein
VLPTKLRYNPGRIRAIVYAVLVHALVIGLAVIGFRWSMAPSAEKVVQAVVVPEPPERKPDEADLRAQQEQEARDKAEAEKRREAELKKTQEEERQRQAAERKKSEAEAKEKQKRAAEQERKNEEKRRQKSAEQSLREQLAAEEKARQAAARTARTGSEIDKYRYLIKQQVTRNWNRPVGVSKGLTCDVLVRLTQGGEVLSVTVVRSSGNPVFDRSVEYAVYKAAPLPLPDDPTLFDNFRDIKFLFNPEE